MPIPWWPILLLPALVAPAHPAKEPGLSRAIVQAAGQGDLARVESLIRQGAGLDSKNESGVTPLISAARQARTEVVKTLLAAGADPDVTTRSGRTALIEAASGGHIAIVEALVDAGATLDTRDRLLGTALDAAQLGNHREVVQFLRERGARGSGRSAGDTVCVQRWGGQGFCGTIGEVDRNRYRILVTSLEGCDEGCPAAAECSDGRPVGGDSPNRLVVGSDLWIASWCITTTFPGRRVEPR